MFDTIQLPLTLFVKLLIEDLDEEVVFETELAELCLIFEAILDLVVLDMDDLVTVTELELVDIDADDVEIAFLVDFKAELVILLFVVVVVDFEFVKLLLCLGNFFRLLTLTVLLLDEPGCILLLLELALREEEPDVLERSVVLLRGKVVFVKVEERLVVEDVARK